MYVLVAGGVLFAVAAALLMIALFPSARHQETCRECGAQSPRRSSQPSDVIADDDWSCPMCGTRFDRQGRARNQLST